ncbi:transcriptional regulator, LacI family [Beutenbergia cavernae DSM 12333]|uniref:Transcriptional regulator, LacI family n=1 Tax=Beutenbergia cavernae (strain ATCC BAA-8 / DSM 12333 / CCUG 43141 / JCM 11478 / NBRC 16432 / NCIMB 13614 / HKI 0122) TaxID=471853 RepID=C5C1A8_BEUC1|nr:transcriptional regulator, LacI family [Beutenbergia cavernae DSM 12333]
MADVAKLAGVSHQTVSRVLNDHPSVRPATRQRVLDAMAELAYTPNRLARALVTRRSGLLGVVTSGSAKYGPMSTLIAVEEAARAAGYAVNVAVVRSPTQESMGAVLASFDEQAVEGVVVIAPRATAVEALRAVDSRAPVILVAAGVGTDERFATVSVDQARGARLAVEHLVSLGHRTVAHVSGPDDWFDARERLAGWRSALAEAGLEGELVEGDWTADVGYTAGRQLVADGVPGAIFAANDQLALGLLRAFAEAGVAVPGDVSVVGFDDIEGTAHFFPPLTTVRQDFTRLGEVCLEVLLAAIAAGSTTASAAPEPVAPELVVRSSTGPPSASS